MESGMSSFNLPSLTEFIFFQSRKALVDLHTKLNDPAAFDELTTTYHTLLCATFSTWTTSSPLTPNNFVDFINSVAASLPSSSNANKQSPNVSIFGELLVDMIWSVDTELEELLVESRTAASATVEQTKLSVKDHGILASKAKKVQQTVESDKQKLLIIVKKLIVRLTRSQPYFISLDYRNLVCLLL